MLPGSPETAKPLAAALEQRLAELGYQNGRNIDLVIRIVSPQPDIVEKAITALLPDIDILMVFGTIGGVAAKKVAPQMPTVFCSVGVPVEIELVESLAHPGGMMTQPSKRRSKLMATDCRPSRRSCRSLAASPFCGRPATSTSNMPWPL